MFKASLFGATAAFAGMAAVPTKAAIDPSALCDAAAREAASNSGVPLDILLAITRVETGRGQGKALQPWPWAVNRAGEGAWYSSAEVAVAATESALAEGAENFDVGCFQLNYRWHGDAFASLQDMFDPRSNASYAADFLAGLFRQKGDWPLAIAAYHSRTEARAEQYLAKVEAVLASLSGDAPILAAAFGPAVSARENLYPLLRSGSKGKGGSIVPALFSRGPLIAANP